MATTMYQARVAIAVASTRVALGASVEVAWVDLVAGKSNQGVLRLGSVTVTTSGAATDGKELHPGQEAHLRICDLSEVYINGLVVGDYVTYCAASSA